MNNQTEENTLREVRAAEARGDIETANARWKDFVVALWKPMEKVVPWIKKSESQSGDAK